MMPNRREFLKHLGTLLAATTIPRSFLLRERGEDRQKEVFTSWQALTEKLWKNYPGLLRNTQTFWDTEQLRFQSSEWLQEYAEEREKLSSDTVYGVLITSDAYRGDRPYEERMRDSFQQPFEEMLRRAREEFGVVIPVKLHLDIYYLQDHLFQKPEDPSEDATIRHAARNDGKHGDAYPYTTIGELSQIPWPPNADWIFFDRRPFEYGRYEEPGNQEIMSGLLHEQFHLLGPIDLYRYVFTIYDFYLNENKEKTSIHLSLIGWIENLIENTTLARDDIMHTLSGQPELSALSALQIAVAQAQGIQSTMHDGVPDLSMRPTARYEINIVNDGVTIAGDRTAFGQTVRTLGDEFENPDVHSKLIPRHGSYEDVNKTYMIGVTLRNGNEQFTLPVPSIFYLLEKFRNPLPNHNSPPIELNIDSSKLFEHLKLMRESISIYNIDIRIVRDDEIDNIHDPEKNQYVLATAPISTHDSLFHTRTHPTFSMIWVAYRTPQR